MLREQHQDVVRASLGSAPSFEVWCGVTGLGGYREGGGWHGRAKAGDFNYRRNGYCAMRHGKSFGGEEAGAGLGLRRAAVEVYDRACLAVDGRPADMTGRKIGESTAAAWRRIHRVSDALALYFAPYFGEHRGVDRRPVPKFATAKLEAFQPLVDEGELIVPLDQAPLQVLRDYEAARLPLVIGPPSKTPGSTRNPALGLMDLPEHLVVAVCDLGGRSLRWGAIDFGDASAAYEGEAGANGDIMHVDMGTRARPRAAAVTA